MSESAATTAPVTIGASSSTEKLVATAAGASFAPWIVTVTVAIVPSIESTGKDSVSAWPAPSDWIASCAFTAL